MGRVLTFIAVLLLLLTASANAQISFVGCGKGVGSSGANVTVPVALNAACTANTTPFQCCTGSTTGTCTVNGDVLVAGVASTSAATQASWTVIGTAFTGTNPHVTLLDRVASSEPANYVFTVTADGAGVICTFRGVNTTTPLDPLSPATNFVDSSSSAGSATATAPSITTTIANDYLLSFFGLGAGSFVGPATVGATNQFAAANNYGNSISYLALGAAGSTTAQTGTLTSGPWEGASMALQPAPTATPTPTPTQTGTPTPTPSPTPTAGGPTPTPGPTAVPHETLRILNSSKAVLNCGSTSAVSTTYNRSAFVITSGGFITNSFTGVASGTVANPNLNVRIVNAAGHIVNGTTSVTAGAAALTVRVVSSTGAVLSPGTDSGFAANYNETVRVVDSTGKVCDAL